MPDERLNKNQRREQARELARKEREKAQRRERMLKILVPVIIAVVLIGGGVGVGFAIALNQPAPASANGPKNMISDGIVFTGQNGAIAVTTTAALKKGEQPTPAPTATASGDPVHITTYVDLSCPYCQEFELTNLSQIESMVKAGTAVLEVKPVAILGQSYQGSQYSQRVNTAAACVANYAPDSFLAVMKQLYQDQPAETSTGLTNSQITQEIHKAGLINADVDKCVSGQSFSAWVTAATNRATSDTSLIASGATGFGTPTIVINDKLYSGSLTDASAFKQAVEAAAA